MIRPAKRALLALALSVCTLPALAQPPQVTGQGGQVTPGTPSVMYETPSAGGPARQVTPDNPLDVKCSNCGSSGPSGGGAITAAPASYSTGALVDGADTTLGTEGDNAWSLTGSATQIAISKKIALLLSGAIGVTGTVSVSNLPTVTPSGGVTGLVISGGVADGNAPATYSPPVAGVDGSGKKRTLQTDSLGDLTPAQATPATTTTTVPAGGSAATQIAAADLKAMGTDIQCASGGVGVGLNGQALTSAAVGGGADLVLSAGANPIIRPQFGTTSAITAYNGNSSAQVCVVVRYDRP